MSISVKNIIKPEGMNESEHAELCWKKAMGNYTDLSCENVYRNVYVDSGSKRINILDEIYKRSGGISRNPFIFRLLADFQPSNKA
jgi:hypothetical protein